MPDHLFAGENRVCGVIAARTARQAVRQIRDAVRYTRTIELRLDWLRSPGEVCRLLKSLRSTYFSSQINFIATCRRRIAGGKFAGTIAEQLSLLHLAIRSGCKLTDIEIESIESFPAFALDLYTAHARRILSFHDFERLPQPAPLRRISGRMEHLCQNRGFDATKIAAKCQTLRDSLRLFELTPTRRNMIAVPMGESVASMRILSLREGSALSYAPAGMATAPGQICLSEMCDSFRAASLTRQTRVYGVIGNPIAHSLSPTLHNAGFRARRIDAISLPFCVGKLNDFLDAVQRLGIAGFSVTHPFKQEILPHLHDCDPLTKEIGAVNTVVCANGKLFGYNTDSIGILRALAGRMGISGSRVLILGAGGAARAAAFILARAGASVSICSRRMENAREVAQAANGEAIARTAVHNRFFDAIINATPIGMHPNQHESPLTSAELNCALAFDMVYRPQRTTFLALAAQRGIKTVLGLEMFLAQGIAQWEIWTGARAPMKAMRSAVLAVLRHDEVRMEPRR